MATNIINSDGSYVKAALHTNIYTIEWYLPQGNSLTSVMMADLLHEISYASHNNDVRVVLFRAGRNGFLRRRLTNRIAGNTK